MHFCEIKECGAMFLGMNYFVAILDDDSRVAMCPRCYRKMRRLQAERVTV